MAVDPAWPVVTATRVQVAPSSYETSTVGGPMWPVVAPGCPYAVIGTGNATLAGAALCVSSAGENWTASSGSRVAVAPSTCCEWNVHEASIMVDRAYGGAPS